uniref:EDRF1 N-terminal domain-containing protein n=1 Tax=Oncorhynchus tshawytscha TaxID=74940 RepID=A0A8C8ESI4_ONCTS
MCQRSREMCLGNNEIKNRAVKYSAAPQPTTYALLQEKTDLKLPPANWLLESPQRGPTGTSVLGSSSKSKPFSRCDIWWYNIKKIPYSKSHVSMAVHRVGRTLLLDELALHEFFSGTRGDWTRLMEFYQRVIDQKWQRKKKSKEHWYQKSKFKYYNINGDGATEPEPESDNPDCGAEEFGPSWPVTFISTASDSEEAAAHRGRPHFMEMSFVSLIVNENDFVRNIFWMFEDIHMLVGSNMPIFGEGCYPACVTRRLKKIYQRTVMRMAPAVPPQTHRMIAKL